jgi:hypothetical protein
VCILNGFEIRDLPEKQRRAKKKTRHFEREERSPPRFRIHLGRVVLERERSSQIDEKGVVREAMAEIHGPRDRDSPSRVDSCLPVGKEIEQMQMPKERS